MVRKRKDDTDSKNPNETNKLRKVNHDFNVNEDEEVVICATCSKQCGEKERSYCSCCDEHAGCDDCWPDNGSFCSQCNIFVCNDCDGSDESIVYCDVCLEIYCDECGDLKPGKEGKMHCSFCQPWWMKNKPASAFCSGCGSQRQSAHFCDDCRKRYCSQCPGFLCERCRLYFKCETCRNDGDFCNKCEESDQQICTECCYGHGDDDDEEGEEDEENAS